MSYHSDLDLQLQEVRQAMVEQPLAQWINSTLAFTEELTAQVLGEHCYSTKPQILEALGMSEDDIFAMARIGTRLQLIASNIESRSPLRVVRGTRR